MSQNLSEITTATNNLNIEAIKKLHIAGQGKGYQVSVTVLVTNKNPIGLRLRNGLFDIVFYSDTDDVNIGKTQIGGDDVPKDLLGNGKETTMDLVVNNVPVEKIIRMINIVGDPISTRKITLKGKSEIGLQIDRGWGLEPGRYFEVELSWEPDIQRNVLMK